MPVPIRRFRDVLSLWFRPAGVYTFIGAGGKTTCMKRAAAFLAEIGVRARLATTTRVGIDEFQGIPVSLVRSPLDFSRALADDAPVRLLVGSAAPEQGKYLGLNPSLIETVSLRRDTALLVEGDGSRRLPMKAPQDHEPVIPANTCTVFALMGASAFGEPIDEAHCYNHGKVLALTGTAGATFEPSVIAALCSSPEGYRKGVRSGMGFKLLVNQGDLEQKRGLAVEALELAKAEYGCGGALVSLQKGVLYHITDD
jgi:probable selenium-dependent hydroxylase accessory protein YqeC